MATEVWKLRLIIRGATIEVSCNDFETVCKIYDALMDIEEAKGDEDM